MKLKCVILVIINTAFVLTLTWLYMTNYKIGEIAEKYETGGKGPGAISTDKGDPGGTSYGSYQIATKVGTMAGYLKRNTPYTKQLNQFSVGSSGFNNTWKELAQKDPEGFKQDQFDYISTISYNPARKYADKLGWPDSVAIDSALFSVSNQHGGWKKIMDAVHLEFLETESSIINKFYDARANYVASLTKSLNAAMIRNIIKNRCINERKDVLQLVGNNG